MKKIKLYIVTYNNPEHLNQNLASLFRTAPSGDSLEVTIINNYPQLFLDQSFHGKVHIMQNGTRPSFSVGHLSRDWNAGIVNGFVSLTDPQADLVILSQDDTIWHETSITAISNASDKYSAIFLGNGDCVCAFRPEAIRRIGLWDERFSCNGFHELDMFLRAALYNGPETSINDVWHQLLPKARGRYGFNPYIWNPLPYGPTDLIYRPDSNPDRKQDKVKYSVYHHIPRELFKYKWGMYPELMPLAMQVEIHSSGPITPQFIMYPYFEKDVYELEKKKYLTCDPYNWV